MTEQNWDRFDAKEWARGHEQLCTERHRNVNSKLAIVIHILGWGGGALFSTLVLFAGYTYTRDQHLEDEQRATAERALSAIQMTADKASTETARKLGATP